MDWKELVASLVGSLAWPTSAAVIALLFRRQVASLLEGPLRRLKAGPIELEWPEAVAELAESVIVDEPSRSVEIDAEIEHAKKLAEEAPAVAVGKAFGLVERRLRAIAAESAKDPPTEGESAVALAIRLRERGLVSTEDINAIRGVATLRNLAVHGPGGQTTVQRAQEYVVLVEAVLYALSRRPGEGGGSPPGGRSQGPAPVLPGGGPEGAQAAEGTRSGADSA